MAKSANPILVVLLPAIVFFFAAIPLGLVWLALNDWCIWGSQHAEIVLLCRTPRWGEPILLGAGGAWCAFLFVCPAARFAGEYRLLFSWLLFTVAALFSLVGFSFVALKSSQSDFLLAAEYIATLAGALMAVLVVQVEVFSEDTSSK